MRLEQRARDEITLKAKRDELAQVRAKRAASQSALARLKEEVAAFERRYTQTLGRRLAELERLEADIGRLGGYSDRDSWWDELLEELPAAPCARSDGEDIKSLYREVAKAVHPDLAGDDGRSGRHDLMTRANRAYAEEDVRALKEILRVWEASVEAQALSGGVTELSRLLREITFERRELQEANAQLEELRSSFVCRLKLRVEADPERGRELFADLVEAVEINISRARRRLARLSGGKAQPASPWSGKCRSISFPDRSLGRLYLRERTSNNFTRWERYVVAQGIVQVPIEAAVRLDVTHGTLPPLERLGELKPDDLQALYLYQAQDRDAEAILYCTGLEELYLAGGDLTDDALQHLHRVSTLKRVYLYQTSVTDRGLVHLQRLPGLQGLTCSGNRISEEALSLFQMFRPAVKTVTFAWKR